jgi:hypothetical protein
MSPPDSGRDAQYTGVSHSEATGWVGWIFLGAILLTFLGTVHLLTGLVAFLRPQILAATRSDLLLPVSLETLAWLHVLIGAVAVVTGPALIRSRRWARISAIVLCCLAILVNFAFVNVYPMWAITAIAVAAVVIYSVGVHGPELADAHGSS